LVTFSRADDAAVYDLVDDLDNPVDALPLVIDFIFVSQLITSS
jgi:hypothetical protein